MNDKIYIKEVVIGALILIIITLSLKLLSLEVNFIPSWLFQNLFLGIFTLAGAFFGASQAGKFTLRSVKEQINYDRAKSEKYHIDRYKKMTPIIRRHVDSLFNYFRQLDFLIVENESGTNVYDINFEDEILDEFKKIIRTKNVIEKIDIDLMSIKVNGYIQKTLFIIIEIETYLDTYVKGIDATNKSRVSDIRGKIIEVNKLFVQIQQNLEN